MSETSLEYLWGISGSSWLWYLRDLGGSRILQEGLWWGVLRSSGAVEAAGWPGPGMDAKVGTSLQPFATIQLFVNFTTRF